MCRIVGFWDYNYRGDYDLASAIVNMRDVLATGGPDDAGLYLDDTAHLALGHRRLSILDLSSNGHQPMSNDSGDLWIVYNGEVYNFEKIRASLSCNGVSFKSNSDTEVVLKSYDQRGPACLHDFRGMWAMALFDKRELSLTLIRDRVGIKPLYWYYKNGLFMFASELKAFHQHPRFEKELDHNALSLYLQLGYIPAPYAIFKHTHKLRPGHILKLDRHGGLSHEKYWDIEDYYQSHPAQCGEGSDERSEDAVMEELESILTASCKLRMVADVPVGVFLSGGIDSSLVTALLQKESSQPLKTFTIGFHETDHNEAHWAKRIAEHLGTEHTELYCTADNAMDIIPKLPELYDEPFGDSSAIPTHMVSLLAKQDVKVALSADGGDEQFCGYDKYLKLNRINALSGSAVASPLLGAVRLLSPEIVALLYKPLKSILPKCPNFKDKYAKLRRILSTRDLRERFLLSQSFFFRGDFERLSLPRPHVLGQFGGRSSLDSISDMMLIDYKTYMPDDILTKVDRASMGTALEARVPLLDNEISQYVASLPLHYKLRNGETKYLLKKILHRYVPKKLFDRPKQGFAVPISDWFRRQLKHLYMEYLNERRVASEGIFDAAYVKTLLNQYMSDSGINHNKLWLLYTFQIWKEKYM